MPNSEDITARYSAACVAFDHAMTEPGLGVPLSADRADAVREFVEATTAYADDLEAHGHAVPHGLRGHIEGARLLIQT